MTIEINDKLVPLGVRGGVFPTRLLRVFYRVVNVFSCYVLNCYNTMTIPTIPAREKGFYGRDALPPFFICTSVVPGASRPSVIVYNFWVVVSG